MTDRKNKARIIRSLDGRRIRFTHRFNTWQVLKPNGDWRNIRPELARCYAAAGFPIGVQGLPAPVQYELF